MRPSGQADVREAASKAARPNAGIQVIARATEVLRIVASRKGSGCRLREIVERSGLNRATAYRIVRALCEQGLLAKGPDSRTYFLGLEFLTLGTLASNRSRIRDLARPSLLRLAGAFGDSFFLFVPDGYQNVCIDICDGDYPVRSYTRGIGGRVPLGLGQASLAILALLPRAEQDEIISHNMEILEKDYGILKERLLAELASARETGYSQGTGSRVLPEYTGLGMPILNADGRPVAAISCCVLASRLSREKRHQLRFRLAEEIQLIQRALNPLDPVINRASMSFHPVAADS